MSESINQKKLKGKIESLIDFLPPNIELRKKATAQVRNSSIYRCVLGCSLNGNSISRSSGDVRWTKKEESKSLVLERR